MKKLLILGMMVLFLSSLIAVESEPSDVVGFMKYDLNTGRNFIALPMNSGYATSVDVAGDISGSDQMSYFDEITQSWVTSGKNMFGNWVTPFNVDGGMAIMARTTVASSFYSAGSMFDPEPNYSIVVGRNSIMVPFSKATLTTSSTLADDIGGIDQMSYFDSTTQAWVTSGKNMFGNWVTPFDVNVGMAVMARSISTTSWPTVRNSKISKFNKK